MYSCASEKSKTLIRTILSKRVDIDKCKAHFITKILILFLRIPMRYNFKSMERYGDYSEKTYRINFEKYGTSFCLISELEGLDSSFDFKWFNKTLIKEHLSDNLLVVFDPSFLPKAGKKTYGVSYRWSGCAGRAKWGMELGGLGVVDLAYQSAFHYEGILTPSDEELKAKNQTLLDHYAEIIVERKDDLRDFSKYLVVDGFFSKKDFVDKILSETDLEIVSKLRKDSALRYLYDGSRTGKRGRPKTFDGKVDLKDINNLKSRYFKTVLVDEDKVIKEGIVWSNALQRKVKLAYVQFKNEAGELTNRYVLLFSTDLNLSAIEIVEFYTARFQIEFLFRDAKQHTGLTHCQARKEEKIYFHVNTALTAVNIAKIAHWIEQPTDEQGKRPPFSLSSIKTLYFNELTLNLFISMFDIDPNTEINKAKYRHLIHFGSIAA